MLLSVSADLNRAIELDDELLDLADHVEAIEKSLSEAAPLLNDSPDRQSERVFGHRIAVDLIANMSAVFAQHDLLTRRGKRASLPRGFIETAKIVGDAMGLYLSEKTWRNVVAESAPATKLPAN